MPTTTDRCTCPTASAVCDGPQPDCPVHGMDATAALQFALDRGSEHPSGTGPE